MSKEDKDMGVVYVLTNPMMPGIVKIGMTTRSNVNARMQELYGTGVPLPFTCEYACSVPSNKCKQLEHALHLAFNPYRVNPNREFFSIEPYQAIELLKYVDEGASDMTEEVTNDIESQLSAGDKAAVAADVLKKQSKRPPLNFKTMGIPMDAILTYTKDKNITCRVCSDRKVVFEDEITSLTAITKKLLNTVHAPQPTPHWSYNGTNLQDIYDETFPFED